MSIWKSTVLSMLIVSSVMLLGCSKKTEETEAVPYVMVVQPATTLNEQQSYAGEVQARQATDLAFRVGGQITERFVNVGDRVKVGQVLAKLDVKDAQLQLNSAKAQLDSTQSAAKVAADELKRFQQLLPMHAVSQSQYDVVKNQYEAAIAAAKQAQANFNVSANQTGYNQLLANKNGVITKRNIEVGQVIAAGQAAYQLAIDGDREVVIGVPEQAVAKIQVGQQAWVTLWSKPEEKFAAYVREISPAADASRTFSAKVALKEGQGSIQMGQSARVFFNHQQHDVLMVPLSSVSANGQQAYVWVVNPNHSIRKVLVGLGAYGRDRVQVTQGLNAQDWVVVGGVHLLHEQQKIHPIDRENRAVQIQAVAKNTQTGVQP
ncbi:efflux RND transporter periplasmic adaptor subunit [Acinetobacter pullicarnis]|uniref:efflux RND transporter periplasmic adaptor subunit n=1 Tax=Acinetobacter pullicarnis TaxID=2576829 RepID=UPI00112242C7|nr:efflux RND transporter periplasmic adaptor subunit [Acinetobacter pullicarnis]